jgi:hypothetical protein
LGGRIGVFSTAVVVESAALGASTFDGAVAIAANDLAVAKVTAVMGWLWLVGSAHQQRSYIELWYIRVEQDETRNEKRDESVGDPAFESFSLLQHLP